jgi:hypothetical protein
MQIFSEAKNWSFQKIINIDRPLANLTKRRRERTQIHKIRNEKEDIITNIKAIQRVIREYFENLYSNKLEKSRRNG